MQLVIDKLQEMQSFEMVSFEDLFDLQQFVLGLLAFVILLPHHLHWIHTKFHEFFSITFVNRAMLAFSPFAFLPKILEQVK